MNTSSWILAALALVNTVVVYWQLAALRKKNDFDIIRDVDSMIRGRFKDVSAQEFYKFAQRFADANRELSTAQPRVWHERSLEERLYVVSELEPDECSKDIGRLRSVVNVYNDIAQHIELGLVDARAFVSKYHLMLIREGWIVEPYIYFESIERNPGRWGLRVLQLLDAARAYQETSSLHGGDVYLLHPDGVRDTLCGCVWRPTEWSFCA